MSINVWRTQLYRYTTWRCITDAVVDGLLLQLMRRTRSSQHWLIDNFFTRRMLTTCESGHRRAHQRRTGRGPMDHWRRRGPQWRLEGGSGERRAGVIALVRRRDGVRSYIVPGRLETRRHGGVYADHSRLTAGRRRHGTVVAKHGEMRRRGGHQLSSIASHRIWIWRRSTPLSTINNHWCRDCPPGGPRPPRQRSAKTKIEFVISGLLTWELINTSSSD